MRLDHVVFFFLLSEFSDCIDSMKTRAKQEIIKISFINTGMLFAKIKFKAVNKITRTDVINLNFVIGPAF